jgi:hypothetical protein
MKFKQLFFIAAAAIMSAPALPSVAGGNDSTLYGEPAQSSVAARKILIDPNTRYVNIKQGESVNFSVGGKTFGWHFNGAANRAAFDLRDIAPPDMLDWPVTVYVAGDPDDKG